MKRDELEWYVYNAESSAQLLAAIDAYVAAERERLAQLIEAEVAPWRVDSASAAYFAAAHLIRNAGKSDG